MSENIHILDRVGHNWWALNLELSDKAFSSHFYCRKRLLELFVTLKQGYSPQSCMNDITYGELKVHHYRQNSYHLGIDTTIMCFIDV